MPTPDEIRQIREQVAKTKSTAAEADLLAGARAELYERAQYNMTLHVPSPEAAERMDNVRAVFKGVAIVAIQQGVPSRELSLALTHLEDALQYTIASIARNQGAL